MPLLELSSSAESNTVSDAIKYIKNPKFVTKSAEKTNEILVTEKNKKYLARDFSFLFKLFQKKFQKNKYYLQSALFSSKYPETFKSPKKQILKKYWKFATNLNKYHTKKQSEKYKIKMAFSCNGKKLNTIKKKNKPIREKDLRLNYYNPQAKNGLT